MKILVKKFYFFFKNKLKYIISNYYKKKFKIYRKN